MIETRNPKLDDDDDDDVKRYASPLIFILQGNAAMIGFRAASRGNASPLMLMMLAVHHPMTRWGG